MHKNQFLITRESPTRDFGLLSRPFVSFTIFYHASLQSTVVSHEGVDLAILGFVIDPFEPMATNFDIAKALAETCDTKEKLFQKHQTLAGRFCMLYSAGQDQIVLCDACGSRRVFFNVNSGSITMTSSLQLFWDFFATAPRVSEPKQTMVSLSQFELSERSWFGSESIDDRLEGLGVNHFLDLKSCNVRRIPVDQAQLVNQTEAPEYAASILKGCIQAITRRFRVVQPLTAGWDSRTTLAASRGVESEMEFYVLITDGDDETSPDVSIPIRLSGALNLFFRAVRPGSVRRDFVTLCEGQRITPQPSRMAEIQYLFDQYHDRPTVRIAGHAADILKSSFYGFTRSEPTADMLYALSPYYRRSIFVENALKNWLEGAREHCKSLEIQVLDLFYWEQRIGNWGSLYAFEQDIAMEEFWPHGVRNLLLSGLRIPPHVRSRPHCHFHKDIVKRLWKEALVEPCNPVSFAKGLKWRARNHTRLRYYKVRLFG